MLNFFLFRRALINHLDYSTALIAGVAAVAFVLFIDIGGEDTQFIYILENLLDLGSHKAKLPLKFFLIGLHTGRRRLSLN
jgi:hypothetical protein